VATTAPISLGTWLPDQTVHIRSFSKSHGPDLRLAAMSGPSHVMDGVRERRLLGQGWTSRLLQAVLLDLLTREESRMQIECARAAYAHRRSTMSYELSQLGLASADGDGLNLWLPVRDETAALLFLASRGIGAAAGTPFATKNSHSPHLRITVGLIVDDFARIAKELAEASRITPSVGPR
jgi:DNA-binding transcriptional MocR family regulator